MLFYLERVEALDGIAHLRRSLAGHVRENVYVTPSGMLSRSYLAGPSRRSAPHRHPPVRSDDRSPIDQQE
ncbi:hypothetical protein AB0M95_27705 [Sphaerisporangium sp. NPDC051017]|uniref:hypothetical protein n=1 Tax=Sphaerisporangium sp. NPDC051017 TaxID=3154636 RepID=UPI0034265ED9